MDCNRTFHEDIKSKFKACPFCGKKFDLYGRISRFIEDYELALYCISICAMKAFLHIALM